MSFVEALWQCCKVVTGAGAVLPASCGSCVS